MLRTIHLLLVEMHAETGNMVDTFHTVYNSSLCIMLCPTQNVVSYVPLTNVAIQPEKVNEVVGFRKCAIASYL